MSRMFPRGFTEKRLLIVDSDVTHGHMLATVFSPAGYRVDVVPHQEALAVLSERGRAYENVVVRATPEQSTLSAADRLGEFVLRYLSQTIPELLPHTVVLTTLPEARRNFPAVRAVIEEPFDLAALVAEVAAAPRPPRSA